MYRFVALLRYVPFSYKSSFKHPAAIVHNDKKNLTIGTFHSIPQLLSLAILPPLSTQCVLPKRQSWNF